MSNVNKVGNLFSYTAKLFYEDIDGLLSTQGKGIEDLLFPIEKSTIEDQILMEKYVTNPEGITFRQRDTQSHIRPYKPGKGVFYTVPRSSEITPISEVLRDSVIAGASTGNFDAYQAEMMTQIINDHTVAFKKTRTKQAIDTFRTGKFVPIDEKGLQLEDGFIDFGRASANDITYDFTASGADIDAALLKAYNVYRDAKGSLNNVVMILGSSWLNAFSQLANDSKSLKRIAQVQSTTLTLNQVPPQLEGVQGLFVIAKYLIPGTVAPVYICGYEPSMTWLQKVGDVEADFFPANEMLVFSLNDPRWSVFGGQDILNDAQKIVRTSGHLTFDNYFEFDPPTYLFRSQSRWIYLVGDINKIVRSTGTFA